MTPSGQCGGFSARSDAAYARLGGREIEQGACHEFVILHAVRFIARATRACTHRKQLFFAGQARRTPIAERYRRGWRSFGRSRCAGDRLAILAPNRLECRFVRCQRAPGRDHGADQLAAVGRRSGPCHWRMYHPCVPIVPMNSRTCRNRLDTLRYTPHWPAWQSISTLYLEPHAPAADLPDGPTTVGSSSSTPPLWVGGRAAHRFFAWWPARWHAKRNCLAWQPMPQDVNLGVLPLFHVAAIGHMLHTQQAAGDAAATF